MRILAVAALAAVVSGCVKPPSSTLGLSDPSDASIRVRPAAYRSVGAGYESHRPVGPNDWMKTNRSVTPGAR